MQRHGVAAIGNASRDLRTRKVAVGLFPCIANPKLSL